MFFTRLNYTADHLLDIVKASSHRAWDHLATIILMRLCQNLGLLRQNFKATVGYLRPMRPFVSIVSCCAATGSTVSWLSQQHPPNFPSLQPKQPPKTGPSSRSDYCDQLATLATTLWLLRPCLESHQFHFWTKVKKSQEHFTFYVTSLNLLATTHAADATTMTGCIHSPASLNKSQSNTVARPVWGRLKQD